MATYRGPSPTGVLPSLAAPLRLHFRGFINALVEIDRGRGHSVARGVLFDIAVYLVSMGLVIGKRVLDGLEGQMGIGTAHASGAAELPSRKDN